MLVGDGAEQRLPARRPIGPELDAWLSREFAPERLNQAIAAMAADQGDVPHTAEEQKIRMEIEECERKLRQYREALDGGAAVSATRDRDSAPSRPDPTESTSSPS
ncbi:hypothetical protein GCM10022205_26480 [Spinactinospora alkalitolerans]